MKDYKLGKLLGFDVYIDLDARPWVREADKVSMFNMACNVFEHFHKLAVKSSNPHQKEKGR